MGIFVKFYIVKSCLKNFIFFQKYYSVLRSDGYNNDKSKDGFDENKHMSCVQSKKKGFKK